VGSSTQVKTRWILRRRKPPALPAVSSEKPGLGPGGKGVGCDVHACIFEARCKIHQDALLQQTFSLYSPFRFAMC